MQDSASFWTDIKKLEEQLNSAPNSFCFAQLAEVYLKVGLVDDALHTARQGVLKHPGYLAGQRALSLACQAKGLADEALTALLLVTEALPEDVLSQKRLGRLYAEAGNRSAASSAFRTALEFAPDDVECRIELEALERPAEQNGDDEDIIEDLEVLEEGYFESDFEVLGGLPPAAAESAPVHDPLSTGTLAELYVKQGFIHKALEIYRAILADNPDDQGVSERVAELVEMEAASTETDVLNDDYIEDEAELEPELSIPAEPQVSGNDEPTAVFEPEVDAFKINQAFEDVLVDESAVFAVSPRGVADNALATLDGWLENIRRIKSCR